MSSCRKKDPNNQRLNRESASLASFANSISDIRSKRLFSEQNQPPRTFCRSGRKPLFGFYGTLSVIFKAAQKSFSIYVGSNPQASKCHQCVTRAAAEMQTNIP